MKTKLLLFAAVLITSITFSQTSKRGYNFYMATSDFPQSQKRNKGELIDAMAKDASLSKADAGKALNPLISKSATRTGRNPQTGNRFKYKMERQVKLVCQKQMQKELQEQEEIHKQVQLLKTILKNLKEN
tara:strand:+ start:523 stop:912 length:390 start_codon:yes stop_codon:yes gene_type:complete